MARFPAWFALVGRATVLMCACVASDSVSIAIHVQPYSAAWVALIPAFKFEHGHVQQQHDTVYTHILTDAANREQATAFHAPQLSGPKKDCHWLNEHRQPCFLGKAQPFCVWPELLNVPCGL